MTLRARPLVLPLCALLGALCGCAAQKEAMESLKPAVSAYNDFVRWKKFENAQLFRAPEERGEFLERYLSSEDDLHVNLVEVRSVQWLHDSQTDEPPQADVTVVAEAYMLPSTVVEKVIMVQHWEHRPDGWILVRTSRELAPALDAASSSGQ